MKKIKFIKDGPAIAAIVGLFLFIVGLPLLIYVENSSAAELSGSISDVVSVSSSSAVVSVDNVLLTAGAFSDTETLYTSEANMDDYSMTFGLFYSVGAFSDTELGIYYDEEGNVINDEPESIFICLSSESANAIDENENIEENDDEYSNLAIANVTDFVNVREAASTDSEIIGLIYDGAVAQVVETVYDSNNEKWFKITSGNVEGYIKAEYFISGNDAADVAGDYVTQYAEVLVDTLNIRSEASADSTRVGYLNHGESVVVIEVLDDGWYKIQYSGDKEGYICGDYADLSESFTYARTIEEDEAIKKAAADQAEREASTTTTENLTYLSVATPPATLYTSNEELRQAIVDYAMQYLGNAYVSGGSTLAGGTDCSGFTSLIYKDFGYTLSRIPNGQYTSDGRFVSYEEAQPGDIVCYSSNGSTCTHVGIYIGNGQIIHSSTPRNGVIIAGITDCGPVLAIKNVID